MSWRANLNLFPANPRTFRMKTSPSTAVFLSAVSWTPRKERRPSTVQFFFFDHSQNAAEILSLIGLDRTSFSFPVPLHALQGGGSGGVFAAAVFPFAFAFVPFAGGTTIAGVSPVPSHFGQTAELFRTWGR